MQTLCTFQKKKKKTFHCFMKIILAAVRFDAFCTLINFFWPPALAYTVMARDELVFSLYST